MDFLYQGERVAVYEDNDWKVCPEDGVARGVLRAFADAFPFAGDFPRGWRGGGYGCLVTPSTSGQAVYLQVRVEAVGEWRGCPGVLVQRCPPAVRVYVGRGASEDPPLTADALLALAADGRKGAAAAAEIIREASPPASASVARSP